MHINRINFLHLYNLTTFNISMKKITLFDKNFKTYIPYKQVEEVIDKVAEKVNEDYGGCEDIPVLLCVMNGSLMFTAELMKRLDFNCELASIKVSSYVGTQSVGEVSVKQSMCADVKGRRVIIVEDIVDTGTTMLALTKYLKDLGASDVKICTLFYKPEAHKHKDELPIDYIAMDIQNQFIVGFGLDYNELGRNYKDIYILDEE